MLWLMKRSIRVSGGDMVGPSELKDSGSVSERGMLGGGLAISWGKDSRGCLSSRREGRCDRFCGKSEAEISAGESLRGASNKDGAFGTGVGRVCWVELESSSIESCCVSTVDALTMSDLPSRAALPRSDQSFSAKLPRVGNFPAPAPALPKCDRFP